MGSLKDVYEIIKELKDLVKQYQNNEMAEKVIAIQEGFFDLREDFENIKDENRKLKEEIRQLNDTAELEKDLELLPKGCYVRKSEQAEGKRICYCSACWQNYKKLMPLVQTIGSATQCSNCHTVVR